MNNSAVYFIDVFAALMMIMGIWILFRPEPVYGYIERKRQDLSTHVLAVVVRVILGAALILAASQSSFPLTFKVLGGLSIAAAAVFLLIGRKRFQQLLSWALSIGPNTNHIKLLLTQ
ncbi:hypothetical protein [Thalassotalea sp. PS06]|uniref:hypothetical protein n=1 Tax=Thalassotalea sp. PS06 TaxID=2594005 RepID=UPI001163E080|nr:hypothetical protein [Thalassotalea sp. PS06]QDP02608.1 hypothetical protein FNC98_15395 [Thalassotalea sp. PS06]